MYDDKGWSKKVNIPPGYKTLENSVASDNKVARQSNTYIKL